jgi:His-Xaa-Ser system radical SAM maturase HxsB
LRSVALSTRDPTWLLTNDEGDYALVTPAEHDAVRAGALEPGSTRFQDLAAKGLLPNLARSAGLARLDEAVRRTRKGFLLEGPSLHIFVVTLRCDHACHYCQVSRAHVDAQGFDMSLATAEAGVERLFESPSPSLTVEFQGGEPALRFDLIRHIVEAVERRNLVEERAISFSLVSTLHHLTADDLAFCRDHQIHISTSIDGPANLHDGQRPNPSRDGHRATLVGLARARAVVGHGGVVALATITKAALNRPREIVDTYRELGFHSIFLRPVSPYGFALRARRRIGYDVGAFLAFYDEALDYILELNRQGETLVEVYSAILLRHILTPFGSGYVDLRSPAGAGLGVLVYNYDGLVYPADEARMAAETGDRRFALGNVDQPLDILLSSPAMTWLATGSVAETLPGCRDCAFVPFCGADPVYHAAAQGDPVGDRATSEFCRKHLGLFHSLFRRIAEADAETMRTFLAWALQKPRNAISEPGYVER